MDEIKLDEIIDRFPNIEHSYMNISAYQHISTLEYYSTILIYENLNYS